MLTNATNYLTKNVKSNPYGLLTMEFLKDIRTKEEKKELCSHIKVIINQKNINKFGMMHALLENEDKDKKKPSMPVPVPPKKNAKVIDRLLSIAKEISDADLIAVFTELKHNNKNWSSEFSNDGIKVIKTEPGKNYNFINDQLYQSNTPDKCTNKFTKAKKIIIPNAPKSLKSNSETEQQYAPTTKQTRIRPLDSFITPKNC